MKHLTLILISLIALLACSTESEVKTLRLAHGLDVSHPVHKAMVFMGERLAENSNGELTLKIYPSGQLGAERECLELLQIGSLDITKVSAAVIENFVPDYKVLSLPYIFRDKKHAFSVFDGAVGASLLEKGSDYRLRGLCFYDAGSRSFYTKEKPVHHPDDLKGLLIRVQKSNMAVKMVEMLNGSPTPISWGELYTALQQGVVDGAENNPPSFYFSKHYEVCKYYTLDEHTAVPDVLLIGTQTWDRLNEQERMWLQQAADESALHQRTLWEIAEKEALEAVEKAGVTIIKPDKSPFNVQVQGLYEEYEADPSLGQLIEKIRTTP